MIPFAFTQTWLSTRIVGLPISYIPFMFLLMLNFLTYALVGLGKISWHAIRPTLWMGAMIVWAIVATIILKIQGRLVALPDALQDITMYLFYWIFVYISTLTFLYGSHAEERVDQIFRLFMITMGLIVIIGGARYFAIDYGKTMPFLNFFNPLQWRLFESLLLVFFATMAAGWYSAEKKKLYLLLFLVLSVGILLSESRTAYVALGILIIYFSYKQRIWNIFSKNSSLLLIGGIIAGSLLFTLDHDNIQERFKKMNGIFIYLSMDFEKAVEEDHLVRRMGMIIASLEIIKTHPILGVGIGKKNYFENFPQYYLNFFHIGRPHNQYIMVASSLGLIGLTLFLGFLFSILKLGRKALRRWHNVPIYGEKIRYVILGNILIMIMMIGYEFETEPFIWIIWGMSTAFFAERIQCP